ncbi:MAG: RdgB/HAM1 family non-canonical purine NTP pyrophosphatase [Bacteroidia bacterium]
MKLIFASHNQNKVQEINSLLQGIAEVHSLNDIGIFEEIPETGNTLKENASIKAKACFKLTGLNVFADDTGLEVEALNGEPGVYSARYAGPEKLAWKNMEKLMLELESHENKRARFVTFISLIINQEEYFFEGEISGTIIQEMRGTNGFGYDPIFVPDGETRTMAELSPEEKNKISHRAKALEKMKIFLMEYSNK